MWYTRSLGISFLGSCIEGEQNLSDSRVSAVEPSLSEILNLCQLHLQGETEHITSHYSANHYSYSKQKESSNSSCRPLTLCCITLTVLLFITPPLPPPQPALVSFHPEEWHWKNESSLNRHFFFLVQHCWHNFQINLSRAPVKRVVSFLTTSH